MRRRRKSELSRHWLRLRLRLRHSRSVVALACLCLFHLCHSFNLDVRIPVIKSAGADNESYFGYSVAQHRTDRGSRGEPLILVGAPRDNNLQPGTRRSGALWQCRLNNAIEDCSQVATDGKRSLSLANRTYGVYDGSLNRLNPPISSEIKDGQWLGVDVQSQGEGGKVIVCAHRYTVRDVSRYNYQVIDSKRGMLGLCYILDADLTLPRNDAVGYKNLMVVRDAIGGKRLQPLGVAFDDHAEWGVCQVGTSAAFVRKEDLLDDDSDLALFGAPGCFTWRGNVFGQNVGTVRRYDVAVNFETMRPYSKHGHMGLSVTSGRFFGGQVYYVSGAPHAGREGSRTGEVYFFQRDPKDNLFKNDWEFMLKGEVFGAGFGYSLATLDANGDSSPDLLVGAPFYDGGKTGEGGAVYLFLSKRGSLERENYVKIIGTQLESQFSLSIAACGDLNHDGFEDFAVGAPYEKGGGAVYVFFGGPKGLRSHGPNSEVFLQAEMVADQVIRASDLVQHIQELPSSLQTFGSSLSGGMDMDDNGYPDLIVGAYQSNYIFVFRARPIIDIQTFVDETNLKGIDPGQTGCVDDPDSEEACFGFKACFSVDKEVSQQGLALKFKIKAEPKKPVSRVWLRLKDDPALENRSSTVNDTIRIRNGRRREHCTEVVGYVASRGHSDLQSPVQFDMSYSLVQDEPKMIYQRGANLPQINDFPILNQVQAKKRFQATFEKDCGEDDTCQSQLKLIPTLRDRSRELGRTTEGIYELELGSLDGRELVLDILIENGGEAAYEAELDVFFPSAVNYIGLGPDTKLLAPEMKNDTWLSFNLGNPFKGLQHEDQTAHSTSLQLRFRPRSDMDEKLIQFFLSANTSSEQVYDPSTYVNVVIVRRAEVRIVGGGFPEQVHYNGIVRGESDFHELSEIGPQVVHKYLVINGGPSEVDVVTVNIGWPFQVENEKTQGKWLLYLAEPPLLKNGRGVCHLPAFGQKANPLNLTEVNHSSGITARHAPKPPPAPQNFLFGELESLSGGSGSGDSSADLQALVQSLTKSKQKREVEKVVVPQLRRGGTDEGARDLSVVTLDCDRGTAKCLAITCQIYNLPVQVPATIEIRARVWNSTLAEDYHGANVDLVEIFSKAKVTVDPDITQDISDDYVSVRTLARPDARQGQAESQPKWWVVLISILVGLLVLVIIILVLWKVGFFKRKRPLEEDDTDFMMSAHFEKVRLNNGSG